VVPQCALRPHQWVKNVLIFVSLVLDHKLPAGPVLLKAVYAFVAFCCAASAASWFLAFSMFLFLGLAFLKRYSELRPLPATGAPCLEGRGYAWADRELIATMGAASGYLSVLVLALYVNSEQVVVLYSRPTVLLLICPLLLYWISRMWLRAHQGEIDQDAIVAAFRDPLSYTVGVCAAAVMVAAL